MRWVIQKDLLSIGANCTYKEHGEEWANSEIWDLENVKTLFENLSLELDTFLATHLNAHVT